MRLHFIQHVPFETPAFILDWAVKNKFDISMTRLYEENSQFPNLSDIDGLIIMGGPMGVYDEGDYPWLYNEKRFVEKAIITEKKIFGVCLGAQLLASVLGAKVKKHSQKEIGWFPVSKTADGQNHPLLKDLPDTFEAFHWHGDTFGIPEHGNRVFSSEACQNQGFVMNNHIIGLQYHIELKSESIDALIENCGDEIADEPWIQQPETIRDKSLKLLKQSNDMTESLLNRWIVGH